MLEGLNNLTKFGIFFKKQKKITVLVIKRIRFSTKNTTYVHHFLKLKEVTVKH